MTRIRRGLYGSLLLVALGLLGGCIAGGDVRQPIPQERVPAPQPAHRLVVVLPGRGDSLASLQRRGVAQLIQRAWPDADVLLTGLTMPYYIKGVAIRRLHDEVIVPAQRQGHRQLWLAGISLGGMGALLYDRDYPGQAHGLLLMSPYLGDKAIHHEIRAAGGLARWNPGPPQPIGPDTFQRELWRYLQHWSLDPARTDTVWLAYGEQERFRRPIELMSPQLPAGHVLMLPGRHNWSLWQPALLRLLQASAPAAAH